MSLTLFIVNLIVKGIHLHSWKWQIKLFIFFHPHKYWIFLRLNTVVKETGTFSEKSCDNAEQPRICGFVTQAGYLTFSGYTCKFCHNHFTFYLFHPSSTKNCMFHDKGCAVTWKETQTIKWPFMSLLILQFQGFTVNILLFFPYNAVTEWMQGCRLFSAFTT